MEASPDPSPSIAEPGAAPPVARRARWVVVAFWCAIIALYLGLRAVSLDADAPRRLAHGPIGPELLVEPAAKAHEARNWAMTGSFQTNPADNYQFWRPQAPFWVYPLAAAFRVFGTSYATLRMTASFVGLVGLVGVILIAHRRWGSSGALLAGVFFAMDNVGIAFGRSGLLEPIVAAWLILALYTLDRAFDHVAWLAATMLLAVVALGTKLAALPAMPVFLFYGVWVLRRPAGVSRPNAWRLGLVVVGLAVAGLLVAYALTDDFQRTLTWNFRHMVVGQDGGTAYGLDSVDPDDIGPGLAQLPSRLRLGWLAFSVMGILGLLEAAARGWELLRRRATAREVLPAVMFVAFACAVFGATFFAYRFVLLMGPPLLVLAVDFLHRSVGLVRRRYPRASARGLLGVAVGAYAVLHLAAWGYALTQLTYEVRGASRLIQEVIGDRTDAVCIGLWSGPLVLETTCTHFYVKKTFNSTKEKLVALEPSHLIFMEDKKDDTVVIVKRVWPELYRTAKPAGQLTIRSNEVKLFEVDRKAMTRPATKKKKRTLTKADPAAAPAPTSDPAAN